MKLVEQSGHRSKLAINAIFLLASLVIFSRSNYKLRRTSPFQALMIQTVAPLQSFVSNTQKSIRDIIDHYLLNINASKENQDLKKSIDKLEGQVFDFQELARENHRLKELLEFGKGFPYKTVLAQIVARDAKADFKVLRINKGSSQGVRLQDTVVTSEGLVGYVFRLTANFSDVLTVLDSNSKVDGIVDRIRAHGILEGYAKGIILMKYVGKTEPIILNDVVITSGLGNLFPKGIKIGRVTKIERENFGIIQYLEITPTVDFNRLEEVLVLTSREDNKRKKEWDMLDHPVGSR